MDSVGRFQTSLQGRQYLICICELEPLVFLTFFVLSCTSRYKKVVVRFEILVGNANTKHGEGRRRRINKMRKKRWKKLWNGIRKKESMKR
jgi:hypothetical protein